ncbi:hypothetical protein D3C81_2187840 [compost metagenome]
MAALCTGEDISRFSEESSTFMTNYRIGNILARPVQRRLSEYGAESSHGAGTGLHLQFRLIKEQSDWLFFDQRPRRLLVN